MDERVLRRRAPVVACLMLFLLGSVVTTARAESQVHGTDLSFYADDYVRARAIEGECSGLAGDTNLDCEVGIVELQSCIAMFLDLLLTDTCVDSDGDEAVGIVELQSCIAGFLGLLTCASGCGNGVVESPEECEADLDCAEGEGCVHCECRSRLGTRVFSQEPTGTETGFFSSSFVAGGLALGKFVGSLTLEAGAPDDNGVAPITTPSGPFFFGVDILAGTQGRFCMKIDSCEGLIYCDGGTNVDIEMELDSLAAGETMCIRDGTNNCPDDPSSVCCSNACEGFVPETDPPQPVTSGNSAVVTVGANPSQDSGPGAVILTCTGQQVDISPGEAAAQIDLGIDVLTACQTADYTGDPSDQVLSTGTNTATVINECRSPLGPALIEKSGANFSCQTWTTEDGSGSLVFVTLAEEPRAITAGDNANASVLRDDAGGT